MIIHGYNRTTGDMDIWVKSSKENYQNIVGAFREFGMQVFDMTEQNFLDVDQFDVFTFGVPPVSIDIITQTKGLDFEECAHKAMELTVDGIIVRVIHFNDLITAKRASNRAKDQDDIENLMG